MANEWKAKLAGLYWIARKDPIDKLHLNCWPPANRPPLQRPPCRAHIDEWIFYFIIGWFGFSEADIRSVF